MLETGQAPFLAPLTGAWQRLTQRLIGNPLLTGSTLFFISTTLVNGGNYLFNLILGRWLGPALFADVSIIITLFLFFTFITAGFQQTATKFAAIYSAAPPDDGRECAIESVQVSRADQVQSRESQRSEYHA